MEVTFNDWNVFKQITAITASHTTAVAVTVQNSLFDTHLIYSQYLKRTYWNQSNLLSQRDWTLWFTGWNKLYFASARTFVYTQMFAVYDCAHTKCTHVVIVRWIKNAAKTPLCQAVYKIQIRTKPQCLMLATATFNLLFFKAIPFKSVQYWVPMSKLHASFWESSLHASVFLFVVAGLF